MAKRFRSLSTSLSYGGPYPIPSISIIPIWKWLIFESKITGGPFKGGFESSTPRSLIDIYPTLLDAAGIKPVTNQRFDGVSLIGLGSHHVIEQNLF